jgi:hypothetical protein
MVQQRKLGICGQPAVAEQSLRATQRLTTLMQRTLKPMMLGRMLARLLSRWKGGALDPVSHYGARYQGSFDPNDSKISGVVADAREVNRYPPASIDAFRDGELIASTRQFERVNNGWRFVLDLTHPVTPDDILRDRISVFALDRHGTRSTLEMSGAVQLEYLRAAGGTSTTRELTIDFSRDGNSRDYVREGWGGAEREVTWAVGTDSTIAVTFDKPGSRYGLEILLYYAFVVRDKIPSQTLAISISDMLIGKFYPVSRQQLLECDIPPELTQSGEAIIRFHHPDAARPIDFGVGSDFRMLAVAFRRMRLKRYTEDPDTISGAISSA